MFNKLYNWGLGQLHNINNCAAGEEWITRFLSSRLRESRYVRSFAYRFPAPIVQAEPYINPVSKWVPWINVTERDDGAYDVTGPMGNLLHILAQRLKFRYELVRPVDGQWGVVQPDGNWSGMMGMLIRKEVEFALGPFFVSAQRAEIADFTVAVHNDAQVWALVLVSMVCVAGVMMVLQVGESRILNYTTRHTASKAGLWVLQTFAQESSEWLPMHDSGRVLVVTWLAASLVFMSSYSGILTAMLTVPRVTIPIDSLQDLVAQSEIPWRLERGAMMITYLEESDDEVKRTALSGRSGTIPDCWTARHGLVQAQFAAVCDETTQKKVISWDFSTTGQCHLYIAQEKVYSSMVSVAFQRNSPYLEPTNNIILQLFETGIMGRWLNTQLGNTSQCLKPPTTDRRQATHPLSLGAFVGPVLMVLSGWLVALVVLMLECMISALTSAK